MSKTKAEADSWEMECKCGAAVSGPDKKSVEETMARHMKVCKAGEK